MTTAQRILTDEMIAEIQALFPRYPTRQAVTLPALHIVNKQLRYVPIQAVIEIAGLLNLAPAEVQDTLSFYGFFKQDAPHGRTRAWVCRSVSCALRGGEEMLEHMCHKAGIHPGQTTDDGRLTFGVRRMPRGLRLRALHAGRRRTAQKSHPRERRRVLAEFGVIASVRIPASFAGPHRQTR